MGNFLPRTRHAENRQAFYQHDNLGSGNIFSVNSFLSGINISISWRGFSRLPVMHAKRVFVWLSKRKMCYPSHEQKRNLFTDSTANHWHLQGRHPVAMKSRQFTPPCDSATHPQAHMLLPHNSDIIACWTGYALPTLLYAWACPRKKIAEILLKA